ncbi:hypothetical protein ACMYYO_14260 [Dermacoccaceae bacterium W4C1]
MNTTKRLAAAATSVISVAVLGVGTMSPASAAEQGVSTQALRPVGATTSARVLPVTDPAALPTGSTSALRFKVKDDGTLA